MLPSPSVTIFLVFLVILLYQLTTGKLIGPLVINRAKNAGSYWLAILINLLALGLIWPNMAVNISILQWPVPGALAVFRAATPVLNANACPTATAADYGFSENNPIRVGGEQLSGQPRAEAYLRNLMHVDGQRLAFERQGYILKDGATLDYFAVQAGEAEHRLYFDYYSYQAPLAPMGFVCIASVPFQNP
jgi:hypothetical protein